MAPRWCVWLILLVKKAGKIRKLISLFVKLNMYFHSNKKKKHRVLQTGTHILKNLGVYRQIVVRLLKVRNVKPENYLTT